MPSDSESTVEIEDVTPLRETDKALLVSIGGEDSVRQGAQPPRKRP